MNNNQPKEQQLNLFQAMKAMAAWANHAKHMAFKFAQSLPENSTQRATALMLLKAIEDVGAAGEDFEKVVVRFHTSYQAVHDCGSALETEYGEKFLEMVPSPPIQITFGHMPNCEAKCDCGNCDEPIDITGGNTNTTLN